MVESWPRRHPAFHPDLLRPDVVVHGRLPRASRVPVEPPPGVARCRCVPGMLGRDAWEHRSFRAQRLYKQELTGPALKAASMAMLWPDTWHAISPASRTAPQMRNRELHVC